MDQFTGENCWFFNLWAHAPLPPLFFDVPGTALHSPQPLPRALSTWLNSA